MRTDPTDNGGLFIGRRPGTAPIRYRAVPKRGALSRQRRDDALASAILAAMVAVNLTFWGPIPAGWLWVASQVDYQTGSVSVGILVGFVGLLFTLLGGLLRGRLTFHRDREFPLKPPRQRQQDHSGIYRGDVI